MYFKKATAGLFLACSITFINLHAKDLGDNFELYGKISMAFVGQDGSQSLSNNSSRFGFKYERADLVEGFTTGLRAEFGINTSNTSQDVQGSNDPSSVGRFQVDNTSDRPFSSRLAYLWLSKGDFEASIGKNWSVWYDITGITDIFMITGAFASSTYTANSEIIGTSRGVDLLETRYKLGNFYFGAQYKFTGDISTDYDSNGDTILDSTLTLEDSVAASLRYIKGNFMLGVTGINLTSNNNGNKVGKFSATIGSKFAVKDLFVAAMYGDTKDLELIGGKFVSTNNIEALIGWRINTNHQIAVGYNWQTSDEVDYEDYETSKYIASYIYNYKLLELGIEVVYDNSTNVDGTKPDDNQALIGATLYF